MINIISIIVSILLVLLSIGVLFCIYMLFRNDAVYNFRMSVLRVRGLEEYDRLPEYDEMMRKFWVWPLEKFFKK